ncbi:M15 family metallopeptidase [Fodinicola feengrottensis]|uniref:M15 family metallopeptidase n=1 Tax=Fodinicola feengrottensis TaxID=435914 RepID=UPI0013D63E85|nr:M15 family metallopeptidase [Fodinicola feengrottensis]
MRTHRWGSWTVQRAPLDKDADPNGYSSKDGRSFKDEGVVRREVHGLKYGLKGSFQDKYTSTRTTVDPVTKEKKTVTVDHQSTERTKTHEDVDHMAVAIFPSSLGKEPVQVVLHFHGYGFRGGDPYAGYTVSAEAGKKGTVRDVDQEHWEQQLGAVDKEREAAKGPSVVTILVQGRGMSDFGKVPTFDYIADVFSKVPELKEITNYSLIQTAHSGGGFALANSLKSGTAKTSDRGKLPAAEDGKAAPQPSDMVVVFDAEGEVEVTKWAIEQVNALTIALKTVARPEDAQAAIAATPKLRAYFAAGGFYVARYQKQNAALGEAIEKVPAPWRDPTSSAVTVADLFRFIEVSAAGVDHEHLISKGTKGGAKNGAVADALRASTDPTSDRGQAVKWSWAGTTKAAAPVVPTKIPPAVKTTPAVSGTATTMPAAIIKGTTATAPATAPAAAGALKGWRASSAASEYSLTQAQKDAIAAQTPEQRATDAKALKDGTKRLAALIKAEKKATKAKTEMPEADAKELADLRALRTKVAAAQMALKTEDVEDILKAAGHTVVGWYGDVQQGKFLNVSVRVHKDLAEALQRAEAALVADPKANPDKLDAVALGKKLGMSPRAADMRIPKAAVGGTSISMHTFGLAVDLNYAGNPYLVLNGRTAPNVIVRATSLVAGSPVDVGTSLGDTKTSYDKLTGASSALITYLSFKDPANRPALKAAVDAHTPRKGEPTDEAGWLAQIEKDDKAIVGSKDFAGHTSPEKGFIDFQESVVMALAGAGLTWGGTYGGTKDLMHFDLRSGEGAKIDAARQKHKAEK